MLNDNTLLMLGIIALTGTTTNDTIHTSYNKQNILDALDEADLTLASKEIRRQLNDEES